MTLSTLVTDILPESLKLYTTGQLLEPVTAKSYAQPPTPYLMKQHTVKILMAMQCLSF
jgi:hypothetical protein